MQIAIIALCAYLLYRLQGKLYQKCWDHNLNVSIQFHDNKATEDEKIVLDEIVENRKILPLPIVFLKFKLSRHFHEMGEAATAGDRHSRIDMLCVLMNQKLSRKVDLVCDKRGIYEIEGASMEVKSLFLDETYVMDLDCDTKITVYPKTVDARRFQNFMQSVNGSASQQNFMLEDPFLFRGIREYQTYDNIKYINWGATAKTGDLKVNVFETVTSQYASIFLNVQKESMSTSNEVLEESIRLAKTFCMLFSDKGMQSKLYTNGTEENGRKSIVVESGIGMEYISRVNENLAKIFIDETGNYLTYGRNSELDFLDEYEDTIVDSGKKGQIVLISNMQDEDMFAFARKLKKDRLPFLWIVPVSAEKHYREDPTLKGNMFMWRLHFEGYNKENA